MNQKLQEQADRRVEEIMKNSNFAASAARMAEAKGLTGVEAIEYAAGLVDTCRQRCRAGYLQAVADANQRERARVKRILTHPAAQGQQDLARELALKTDIPADQAIEKLREGCASAGSGDAAALARSVLDAGGE
jgi:hypothetical protein